MEAAGSIASPVLFPVVHISCGLLPLAAIVELNLPALPCAVVLPSHPHAGCSPAPPHWLSWTSVAASSCLPTAWAWRCTLPRPWPACSCRAAAPAAMRSWSLLPTGEQAAFSILFTQQAVVFLCVRDACCSLQEEPVVPEMLNASPYRPACCHLRPQVCRLPCRGRPELGRRQHHRRGGGRARCLPPAAHRGACWHRGHHRGFKGASLGSGGTGHAQPAARGRGQLQGRRQGREAGCQPGYGSTANGAWLCSLSCGSCCIHCALTLAHCDTVIVSCSHHPAPTSWCARLVPV